MEFGTGGSPEAVTDTSEEVLPNTPRHAHPFVWLLYRMSLFERGRKMWEEWQSLGILPSALAFGMRLMDSEWQRHTVNAASAWELLSRHGRLQNFGSLQT
mmetsp:Transcript_37274/g.65045  ORF Transcript_37274/g.65045 Transcript_37274/m.65045 type:complete len:100 (+) Transcript_37274:2-301(+)